MSSDFRDQVIEDGFAIVTDVFSTDQIQILVAIQESILNASKERRRGGIRNLLAQPSIRDLAISPQMQALVEPILGLQWFPVRAILFDKVPEANWKVPWHQDLSIAVDRKVEVEGFGPWSEKAGVIHVQPPTGILEQMVAVRIHLDECDAANGPLRVIPKSHRYGRISEKQIERHLTETPVTCLVSSGGVLLMKPLLLHASSPSQSPAHRRVIHIEYAACTLPPELRWHAEFAGELAHPR
jgi:hypothetical protein